MSVPLSPVSPRLVHVQENFVRHLPPLRGFVHALVPRAHLVDDIIQETFLTACAKAESYEPGTNFRAWIFTIARFKVLALIKRDGARAGLLDPDVTELLANEEIFDEAMQARVAALDNCVGKLARTTKTAVVMRYTENLGPTEIAGRLGRSVNSLNVALARARVFLRRCVEEAIHKEKAC